MVPRRLRTPGLIALSFGLLLASSTLLASVFGLWVSETRNREMAEHIQNLATVEATAISTAETGEIAGLATALLESPLVRKLEIYNWGGQALQIFQADDLDEKTERPLLSVSRTIVPEQPDERPGELKVFYALPSSFISWTFVCFSLIAGAICALMIWRGPKALADLTRERDLAKARLARQQTPSKSARHLSKPNGKAAPFGSAFGGLFESHTDMAALISAHGQIVDASHGWVLNGGYSRDKIMSAHLTEFIVDSDRSVVVERLERMRASGVPQAGTLNYLRADGTAMHIWFSAIPVNTADGDHFTLAVIRELPKVDTDSLTDIAPFSDQLTGLLNRYGFEKALKQLLLAENQNLVCLMIDFDRFKSVIDSHGYEAGEEVLRAFIKRLSSSLERVACAARFGGDEFAFVIAGANASERADRLSETIHKLMNQPFPLATGSVTSSVSIGVATADNSVEGADLLRYATIAVSEQKNRGGNGTLWFRHEMFVNTKKRAEIEGDIVLGIEENLFEPYFQPIVKMTSGAIVGFEALMRLNHPEKGLVMPGDFISIAEQTEQIKPAGRQFFAKSLIGLRQIDRQAGNNAHYLSVNLSPVQLNPDMVDFMAEKLDTFKIDPARLTVEITEAVFLEDSNRIRESLQKLRLMGCKLALDDFGTGYSSLSYLSRLQVDIIKIDQSFIRNLTDADAAVASRSRRLIEGIAAISLNMGCQMVAEGVENEEQARQVHAIGVQYGQGYLYSRPLPLSETITRCPDG